jgi:hypothetical protein
MRLRLSACLVFLLTSAAPALADATAFIGSATSPVNRQTKGFAVGMSLLVLGFEFEYATIAENADEAAPALRTGMANVFVQTPLAIAGIRPYATTGLGFYREQIGEADPATNLGFNTGAGVKVSLVGPLRARFDDRVFKLRGEPAHAVVHRFYLGANLAF